MYSEATVHIFLGHVLYIFSQGLVCQDKYHLLIVASLPWPTFPWLHQRICVSTTLPDRTWVDAALAEDNLEMATQYIQAISQPSLASLSQKEVFPVRRLFLKDRKESVLSPA